MVSVNSFQMELTRSFQMRKTYKEKQTKNINITYVAICC